MADLTEPRPCASGCGRLVPAGAQARSSCARCRHQARLDRQAAELEAAAHRAALADLARTVDGRTWNALRLGTRP